MPPQPEARQLRASGPACDRASCHGAWRRADWRLRPMRWLKRLRSAQVIGSGHAFVQNVRRGHHELGLDAEPHHRLAAAFTELAQAI